MTTLFESAVHHLRARVGVVRADMELWSKRTSPAGELAQHGDQLTRLRNFLDGCLDAVVAGKPVDLDVAPPFTGTVDDIPQLRRGIGNIHLLWDFYRDKLAQRDMDAVVTHLGVADDLAEACYRPFLAAATTAGHRTFAPEEVKEPPLVFYATDRTPFAQARAKTLHPAGLDAKDLRDFAAALQRLPVPVIGVPWEFANRLPETTLVGHEAGHVIAEDLGLGAEAKQALQDATFVDDPNGVRRKVWRAWSDEVLADVIGILATGSAFVEGLTAELAGDKKEIQLAPIKAGSPGKYATPMLRVALCAQALTRLGVDAPTAWPDIYGNPDGDSEAYRDDLPVVAEALLERSWSAVGNQRLAAILPWDAAREAAARTVAARVLAQEPTSEFDVRVWVAASMHAYRDQPARYLDLDLDRVLAGHIVGQRTAGVRSSRSLREPMTGGLESMTPADRTAELRDADRRAGAALARQLKII